MFSGFMDNFRLPRGRTGEFLLGMMNRGHGPFLRAMIASLDLAPDSVVLDVGCGGGLSVKLLADRGALVHAVDLSEVSVRKTCRFNAVAIERGRVFVQHCGVDALPYPEGMFDVVTAFETMYFWPDPESAMHRIRRLLKPGGRFLAGMEAYRADGHIVNMPGPFRTIEMHLFTREELDAMGERAGFCQTRIEIGAKHPWLRFEALKSA